MRWSGHVACLGEMKNAYEILVKNLKGGGHLEDVGLDEKMILQWILGTTECIWLRIGTSDGLL